ncbi:MAG TPA: TetR/AcrR family transcriptional regulator, partial [Rhizobiales bacterium]|nr:TetR/AcrR family transcriptional regulator [Hyphomicrobiales bacterium]
MARPSKKEHLVDTAVKLFGRDGFNATGIDKILQEAGVARMTLYKHFKSKDELILAALRRRDEQFRIWFKSAVEKTGGSPAQRLLASFDALEEWFEGR